VKVLIDTNIVLDIALIFRPAPEKEAFCCFGRRFTVE
jgi:hypothetical protein